MKVQVHYLLTRIGTAIGHHAIAPRKAELGGDPANHQQQMAGQGRVFLAQIVQRGDFLLGITGTWTGACGRMSSNARQRSSSKTIFAGISRSMIFLNSVFSLMDILFSPHRVDRVQCLR